MPSYQDIANDVMVAMGYNHDDALRHKEAVLYNVVLVINKLKGQVLDRHSKVGDHRSSADMLSTYIVPVTHNDVADGNVTDFDASYFDLPTAVFDMENGTGINMVRYLRNDLPPNCPPAVARTPFTQTTLAAIHNIYESAYQKPSSSKPYFARARKLGGDTAKDRVYLFGVPSSINHLLIALYAAADFTTVDPTEDVDLPVHLLHTAKQMLLGMESWLLQVPQERLKNDGRDLEPGEIVRTSPAISVNHPANLDS